MEQLSKQQRLVYDLFNEGDEREIMFLNVRNDEKTNRILYHNDKPFINFITNNFLGFENDKRVKEAAIEGINKYGVFTSVSRTYYSYEHYLELEDKLEKIYGNPVLTINNTSQGHFAYLPSIIGQNDLIILDQFVHKTVQVAAQFLKGGGVQLDVLRHNQMEELEKKIKANQDKYNKIWYFTDSVFSMHGTTAPFKDIEVLLNSYEKFNVYIDDAHGMSWIGENGKGYCFHKIAHHERLFVISALNKGFGATCAAMIFPDQKTKDIVHKIGIPLMFSSPAPHSSITAASKIADIHLSPEIYERQMMLNERIVLFRKKCKEYNIPLFNIFSPTPIGYMILGNADATIQFLERMFKKGFILGGSSYPSVPMKHTGVRVLLSLHQTLQDIENLVMSSAETIKELQNLGIYNQEENLKGFSRAQQATIDL